jgi:hypothetical protein
MSRSGYSEDCDDNWALIRWRGAVNSALRGARGQAFLRELVAALDAMPVKELHPNELRDPEGNVCALGAVAQARGMDVSPLDPENTEGVAAAFGLSHALIREVVWVNDEACWYRPAPARRWQLVREWALENLRPTRAATGTGDPAP